MSKREESEVFSDFCNIEGSLVFGEFVHQDAPDFWHRSGSLGVELVSYHRDATTVGPNGSPQRHWEAQLDAMVAEARRQFESTQTKRVHVYIFPHHQPPAQFPRTAAAELLTFVTARAAGHSPTLSPALATIAENISVDPIEWFEETCDWQWVLASWVDVDVRAVQARLDEKERKLHAYRQNTKEVWLLMHGSPGLYVGGDQGRWSTCGHVSEELIRSTFRSSFDRVYYLDGDRHRLARLEL